MANLENSGHVISGQARFGSAKLRYFKLPGKAVRAESRLKRQFGSNSLLFTTFMTVLGDSRPRVNETDSSIKFMVKRVHK